MKRKYITFCYLSVKNKNTSHFVIFRYKTKLHHTLLSFCIKQRIHHILLSFSIQDGSIVVNLSSGGEDTAGALRKQLAKESTKRDPNGAALRWAFAAGPNGGCDLQLQVLPLPANYVSSKPLLLMDNVAVIVAKAWPIQIAIRDGDCGLQGPVPVLYGEQPEQVRSALEDDPAHFAADLNRFMTR